MDEQDETIALQVVGWIVGEGRRAERMLAVTGLSADGLREAVADRRRLGAILDFLLDHEPDLVACARDLGLSPQVLVRTRERLGA